MEALTKQILMIDHGRIVAQNAILRRLLMLEREGGERFFGEPALELVVALGARLLGELRAHWRRYRPRQWLFPGQRPTVHLCDTSIQKAYGAAKAAAGIAKHGGIHSLRHAYATHQLGAGMPVTELQRQLGKSDPQIESAIDGDQPNTDPLLGPLADNGGPTLTHALGVGSPAIDSADAGACPATDQRGVARPQGAGCDVGSFEYVP